MNDGGKKRSDLPRRVGEVLAPALHKLAGGDEARAYGAWARAAGEAVAAGTRPKAFRRGQLVVECVSSVWANELTYLGPQILRRMDEVAPGHPVKGFRFVVGHPSPAPVAEEGGEACGFEAVHAVRDEMPAERMPAWEGQECDPPAAKRKCRRERPATDREDAARAQAKGVRDRRLRAAIEDALRRSAEGGSESSETDLPPG